MSKRPNLRKILSVFAFVMVAFIVMLGVLYAAIQPPKLLVPKRSDLKLGNLAIWNPGSDVVSAQTLHISDGIITKIESSKTDLSFYRTYLKRAANVQP